MINPTGLIAFLSTTTPDVAKAFYEDTLGLQLLSESDVALVFESNGVEIRIQKVKEVIPVAGTLLGWKVERLAEAMADLSRRGVAFERYESLDQDVDGIWTSPNGSRVAWFKDPDGSTLSLTQPPTE